MLPATVIGVKPGTNTVASSTPSTSEGESSSFYRYNPLYGEESIERTAVERKEFPGVVSVGANLFLTETFLVTSGLFCRVALLQ